MTFDLQHRRVTMGQQITVKVDALPAEAIASVSTVLDDQTLGDDNLPSNIQYVRIFNQVGAGGPGMQHELTVTATNDAGMSQTATRKWNDTL